MFEGQPARGFRLHIAHHHDSRVVGRVPASVPGLQMGQLHGVKVRHPAYDGMAIGTSLIGRGQGGFVQIRHRVVLGAQAPLFFDDLQLLLELLFSQNQIAHAVCFQFKTDGQPGRFQDLKVSGVIPASEGVVSAAVLRDDPGEGAVRVVRGAVEHHVFQDMGHAGDAVVFVAGPDLVPDLGDRHRRPVIFLD